MIKNYFLATTFAALSFMGLAQTPTVTITVGGTTISCSNGISVMGTCSSQNLVAAATGGTISSYSWSAAGGATLSSATSATTTVTYTAGTTYTITCTATNTLSQTGSCFFYVNRTLPLPSAAPASVCIGNSTVLNLSGTTAGVTWAPATFLSSTVVPNPNVMTPTVSTSYTATVPDGYGCPPVTATTTITVNPLPTVTANNATICPGASALLTAAGASTYSWNTGATVPSINVTPSTNTTYTVTGTSAAGCTNTATSTVVVNAAPFISPGADQSICMGTVATYTASGALTYTWSTGATTPTATISPASSTTISVQGTDANGCIGSNYASVSIKSLPTITAASAPSNICVGVTTTLTASGASTYTWSNASTGSSVVVSPATNTTYTVTGTNANGCTNTATTIITVNPLPTVTASSATICAGASAFVTAAGANTYSWSTGATVSGINVTPSVTTTYTVTGTSAAGCTNTATSTVVVNPIPNLFPVATPSTICANSSTTLTASGAVTYTWSSPSADLSSTSGATVVATPTASVTYTVIGTDANGCVSSSFSGESPMLTVNPVPTATVASTTPVSCFGSCNGQANINIGGGGPISVSSTSGSFTSNYNSVGTGICAGVQTVTVTAAYGCTVVQTLTVTSPSAIAPNITTTNVSCNGGNDGTATVTVVGGAAPFTYSWSPIGGVSTTATGLNAGTYSVLVVDGSGCTATQAATITEPTFLGVVLTPVSTTCGLANGSMTSNVTGGIAPYTYAWTPSGASTSGISNVPAGTYTLTVTDANGCISLKTNSISASSGPTLTTAASPTVVCGTGSSTLTATGATTYTWQPSSLTGAFVGVNQSATTVYTVTGTDANNCVATATVMVAVTPYDNLSGTIYDTTTVSGVHTLTNGTVYIYKQQNGTTAIDTTGLLANAMSVPVNNSNGTYSFSQIAPGNYYIKAVADTHFYHGAIPTYSSTHPNTYLWDSAVAVVHNGCTSTNDAGHDITIIEIPAASGAGVISGTISTSATFGHRYASGGFNQTMGAPIRGIDVKLGKNPGGGCAARTTADTSGAYQFTGVANGSYNIYVDVPNFGMVTILTATISSATPVSTNNNYCLDSTHVNVCAPTIGIKQITTANNYQVVVYPNPNSGIVNLQMNDYEKATVEVYSVIGQKVYTQQMQNNVQQLNLTALADGVYQIRVVKNNNSVYQTKIIKQ